MKVNLLQVNKSLANAVSNASLEIYLKLSTGKLQIVKSLPLQFQSALKIRLLILLVIIVTGFI